MSEEQLFGRPVPAGSPRLLRGSEGLSNRIYRSDDGEEDEQELDVSIRLSELPTSSNSLVRLFEIESREVFDGSKPNLPSMKYPIHLLCVPYCVVL